MAGAQTRADYVSDNGTTYTRHYPTWLFNLFTAPTTASTTTMPKGMAPRHRYAKVTATGREHRMVVWSAADPLYSGAFNTAVTTEIGAVPGATGFVSTLQGRTGEKSRNI
jgi:hypothetical protein